VISKRDYNLLNLLRKFSCWSKDQSLTLPDSVINFLKHTDGKGSGLAGSRLRLGNDIVVLEDGHDGSLLNGRRTFETFHIRAYLIENTISVDAS
jgi:hypothetical protein